MGLQDAIGRALGVPGIMTVIFTSTCSRPQRALAGRRPLLTSLAAQQPATLAVYLGSAVISGIIIATHWFQVIPSSLSPPFWCCSWGCI
jgi:hypothetical protein